MPRTKRKGLKHKGVTDAHVFQLLVGHDFFHDAFGDDVAAMQAAWSSPEVRRRVYELLAQRQAKGLGTRRTVWAEEQFDEVINGH